MPVARGTPRPRHRLPRGRHVQGNLGVICPALGSTVAESDAVTSPDHIKPSSSTTPSFVPGGVVEELALTEL
jgi:hypothetical protein